jgi:hypothetical protein
VTFFRPQSAGKGVDARARGCGGPRIGVAARRHLETFMSGASVNCRRLATFSGLVASGMLAAAPGAGAADFDYGAPPPVARYYDPPPPYRARVYDEAPAGRPYRERAEAPCRIIHRRAVDDYGREVVRRIRECDEGVVAWGRRGWAAPGYQDDPRGYEAQPRPPRDLGDDYEDDPD